LSNSAISLRTVETLELNLLLLFSLLIDAGDEPRNGRQLSRVGSELVFVYDMPKLAQRTSMNF
jgi:hypothetical protein